jgi:hypothetical protein
MINIQRDTKIIYDYSLLYPQCNFAPLHMRLQQNEY